MASELPIVTGKQMIRLLERDGFVVYKKSKRGHKQLKKDNPYGRPWLPVVPDTSRDLPVGTRTVILRQAGLSRQRFLELYRGIKKK